MVAVARLHRAQGIPPMRRAVLALTLALFAAAGWRLAKACAPEFFRAVFSYARHPDFPRSEFVDGRLGVLQPTLARSYLVIAYRYLNGTGLNPREREQARDYYKDRNTSSWDHTGTNWPERWRAVRSQIKSPPAPKTSLITGGQLAYDSETQSFALNCAEDAFRVAAHTLEARRAQFGVASPAFRSWAGAQDTVFRNCDSQKAEIPPDAPANLPPLIRMDRDYQIAAANFYAGDYAAALERFRRIGRDGSSPWNGISRYLVVRTLFRMTEDPKQAGPARVQMRAEAQAILAEPKLAPVQGMTWNLVQRAGIREKDQVYFRELARLLSAKGQDNGLREELWNYTAIYDRIIGDADPNAIFRSNKQAAADVSRFRDADLTDWIFSFQSRDSPVFTHCLERWRKTQSPAWLLAALSHANGADAKSAGISDAAAAVPETSPGYLTARFHVLRIYEELGENSAARDGLDAVLSGGAVKNLPSSINLFRGLRMMAATSFDDFVHFAPRKPIVVTLQGNFGEVPDFFQEQSMKPPNTGDLFDADATRILNRQTPFRLLQEAALNESLPTALRREALLTAFTRGLMLGEDLTEIAEQLGGALPELAAFTNAYRNETGDEGRRFAAAFLLLHRPEARPYFAVGIPRQSRPGRLDPYRDNWWCPMDVELALDSRANYTWYPAPPNVLRDSARDVTPDFLSGKTSVESKREMATLGSVSAATDFLGGIVIPYVRSHPEDARIPEALYWLVRVGHYGCADVNSWKSTRAAFRILHLRYPASTWAKRTPTWFKNDYDIRSELKAR
jgi:hypothetical protein